MTNLLRLMVGLALALVGAFIGLRLFAIQADLARAPTLQQAIYLLPACVSYASALLMYALFWRAIILRLDSARPAVLDSIAAFCASWLGRYVPSSLPYVAGKVVMGERLGHGRARLAASVLYENVLVVSVGAASSAVVIPLALAGRGGVLTFVAAGLAGAAGLACLSPPVFHRLLNVATRVVRRQPVPREHLLSYSGIMVSSAAILCALVLTGASFAFILQAFVSLGVRDAVAAGAIFNLAGVAGVAALPLPSGLGVREAVLIGLLQVFVPLEIAAAAAVVSRLGSIVVDVLFGVTGGAVFAFRQRQAAPATQLAQQRQLDAA